MSELPETSMPAPSPQVPTWKKACAWTLIVGLYAIVLAMGIFGVKQAVSACGAGVPWNDRLTWGLEAFGLLFLPCLVIWYFVKTRWKTGRWAETKEARQQRRAQCAVRQAGRPKGRAQIPPWSWVRLAAYWGSYNGMDAKAPMWQRVAGWSTLAGFAAMLLAFIGLGLIFLGAGVTTLTSGGAVMIFLAMVVFVVPGMAVWQCILRKRTTGRWHVSQEELEGLNQGQREWRTRENQKPLQSKLISTVVMIALIAWIWVRAYSRHLQHHQSSWFTATLWTIFGIYAVWIQFRAPKNTSSRDIL